MIRLATLLLTAGMLSGCVALGLVPLAGLGAFPTGLVTGAGSAIGSLAVKSEAEAFKAWRKCRRVYKTKQDRIRCMEVWRATR